MRFDDSQTIIAKISLIVLVKSNNYEMCHQDSVLKLYNVIKVELNLL